MEADCLDRFWSKVDKDGPIVPGMDTCCWVWTRGKVGGYGNFDLAGKTKKAHRVAWMLEHGDIPKDMNVLHHCDNPSWVRVSHLWIGTHRQNMQDRTRKGRQNVLDNRGERNGCAKLSHAQVNKIRALYTSGMFLQRELGAIVAFKRWTQVA